MSLSTNRNYALEITKLKHEEDQPFIAALADSLVEELERLGIYAFRLILTERNLYEEDPITWSAQIYGHDVNGTPRVIKDNKRNIACLEAHQQYSATCTTDQRQNYSGKLELSVLTYEVEDKTSGTMHSAPHAKTVLRLALAHYCEQIVAYYPSWITHYTNGLTYQESGVSFG